MYSDRFPSLCLASKGGAADCARRRNQIRAKIAPGTAAVCLDFKFSVLMKNRRTEEHVRVYLRFGAEVMAQKHQRIQDKFYVLLRTV